MDRKQARIDRRIERQVRQQVKAVRLVEKVEAEHEPRTAFTPGGAKTARSEQDPGSIMQMRMSYRIHDHSDRANSWSWGQVRNWCDPIYDANSACVVRSTMIEMGGLYWHEIMGQMTGGRDRHKKHHSQPLDSLCEEAQLRWIEIGREEDELFRFRTGGKQRIWGFRTGHVFNVVWWDAEHQIYPVD
ncbi:hypothetical protein [Rhizobium rhizogenes]|uniref:Uncharacterized protein n=1 Tax=Rhizobium rhizogenes NBRC 13257 TaxID=1220581 RepID=A0AA87U6Z0_RHIRH|nr:hypothetical protein [Rhizobium rhizogenes]NTG68243.1 hypothetical protein [Rhizobium rhizogenes]NTI69062.1 hypothetical protein [Rhizobium rhizogenes]TRB12886.1 hypothetical protein EXN67_09460 [Rhizobium rhizogenes]TRB37455.1 hypothetical protein EXN73_30920 [Rhizobium rhizogenes]TRB52241.1 hypothetical protein EXN71_31360 [Rhizobium rhizogenes]